MKNIYNKPTANILLPGEKTDALFPSKIRNRNKIKLPPLLFNTIQQTLAKVRPKKKKKAIKGIQTGKEEIRSLFTDDTILQAKKKFPKINTKTSWIINDYSNIVGYKVNILSYIPVFNNWNVKLKT